MIYLRYLINLLYAKINPVRYARSMGVTVGSGCRFYSLHPGAFGSEPYLVSIGNDVIITSGVRFITHDGSVFLFRKEFPKMDVMGPISIGDNTFIGINSIIMPGVSIGKNCVIGAMSLVNRSIPDGLVVAGNPAKVIQKIEKLQAKLLVHSCETGHLNPAKKQQELIQRESMPNSSGRIWLSPKHKQNSGV